MQSRFKEKDEDVKIHTPRNLETLNLSFRGERVAKVRIFFFAISNQSAELNLNVLFHS
jgi:hypothetical protein